ncbi:MAG: DNA translocase FtsK 4TM domain-containing protein [Alphaproteobacteria bacterium]
MPKVLRDHIVDHFKFLSGVAVVLIAAVCLLLLLSYNPQDPSWNSAQSGTDHVTTNWLGSFGSVTADLLRQLFGSTSYLLCVVLGAWGWRIMSQRDLDHTGGRAAMALLAMLAASTALHALDGQENATQSGGAFGILIAGKLGGALVPHWGQYIVAAVATMIALGALYMACALTLAEWSAVVAFCHRRCARALRACLATLQKLWRKLRSRGEDAPDTMEEDLVARDESDLEDADDADEKEYVKPVATKTARKPALVQKTAASTRQAKLALDSNRESMLPPYDLLAAHDTTKAGQEIAPEILQRNADTLERVLADFGISGQVTRVSPGPVVTLYELEPAPGIRAARVIALADDIARSMSARSVRVAVVAGRNVIGIELPNQKRETVYMRELLESDAYQDPNAALPLALGKDIAGMPIIADLARMPHLLVAGTTGSGKSVSINTMILSLLYRLPPQRCRFIMVDPKMLELSVYEGIPHLLAPVVTEPKKAIIALKWTVREMEERYRAMSKLGVRNIGGYNMRLQQARERDEKLTRQVQTGFDQSTGKPIFEEQAMDLTDLPYIVVIVDEMADLMLVAGKDIEVTIQRLAQMARAAGIHIIMATQRPSVDVITGTIKANFPTRISFQVTSKIDSRTILGEQGAEQLLGQGDMLYMAGGGRITRVHGPFVRDSEVESIVNFLKAQGEPDYLDEVTEEVEGGDGLSESSSNGDSTGGNDLYDMAVDLVQREGKASTSFLQRHLKLGYNRAATLIEQMEREGVVSAANHVGKREVFNRRA